MLSRVGQGTVSADLPRGCTKSCVRVVTRVGLRLKMTRWFRVNFGHPATLYSMFWYPGRLDESAAAASSERGLIGSCGGAIAHLLKSQECENSNCDPESWIQDEAGPDSAIFLPLSR